ncbi:hypothetical protein [Mycobacteroides salmoniphilum]|uniref:hypothetical protein n=1 Tax=Mycobacteroides salmoniphilum TaxID=404941 RepID=UPI001F24343A|nr:hypothetical protein [Mycobacteroides salmoniphilum]
MELAGFLIQVFGALFTAVGLIVAWDRVKSRISNAYKTFSTGLSVRLAKLHGENRLTPESANVTVKGGRPLIRVEPTWELLNQLDHDARLEQLGRSSAYLDARIDSRIQDFIDSTFAERIRTDELVKLGDTYLALIGLGISFIGFVIEHGPLLQQAFCAAQRGM